MITLKELAKKLNVSVSTVSKALNNSPEISKLTIDRVKALANFYNYKPNKIALSLRQSSTKTIGVIIPSVLNRFFARALKGIEDEANTLGYNIITSMSNELLDKEISSLNVLSNGSVDGFLISISEETQTENKTNHITEIIEQEIPVILFDRNLDVINCDKVIINDFEAAFTATNKLINKNRKDIVFMSCIKDLNVGKLRHDGFSSAIEKANNITANSLMLNRNEDLQKSIENFFKENPKTDGILAADNISGTIAINVAKNLGYKIPENLSVIGFSDDDISNLSVPKLSYVNQNAYEIGAKALNMLVNKLKNKDSLLIFSTEVIPFSIHDKGSL